MVGPHAVQVVTVVVKPDGTPFGPVGQTNGVEVGLRVIVVVRVNVLVTKPVGQTSM